MLEIPDDVQAELTDPVYSNRVHYSRATYAKGCRGPLCRKKERDRERERTEARAIAAGREYKPNMPLRETERDELLNKIISLHRYQLEGQRLEQKARKLAEAS